MMYLGDKAVGIVTGQYIDFNPYSHCNQLYRTFMEVELPESIVIDFEGTYPKNGIPMIFQRSTGVKNITIKNLIMPNDGISMQSAFNDTSAETITFENCRIRPSNISRAFSSNTIKRVNGEMDLTFDTNGDAFYFARGLEHFELIPNTMMRNTSILYTGTTGTVDNETLISIANAMNPEHPSSQDGKSRFEARMKALMGNNVDGLFVADENGETSLWDFIENVKGWTMV